MNEEHTPQHTADTHSQERVDNAREHVDFVVDGVEPPARSSVPMIPQLVIAFLILGGLFGISYVPGLNTRASAPSTIEKSLREQRPVAETATATAVPEPTLGATAAFVWDVRHQRALINKNASAQLPLASLTKLMTSLVALETLGDEGKVRMTLEAILQDGPSDFRDGELMTAKELSDFSLISSSNDGAYALAAAASASLGDASGTTAFVAQMNRRAEELGLTQTYFTNPTGLDQSALTSGSYGSARDMAFLMEYLIKQKPDIVRGSTAAHARVIGSDTHTASNTNEIVDEIPGLLGTKTGYTDLAGGNLVIAFDAGLNRPVIISVLGSTREGRFKDIESLISYAQKKIIENAQ